MKQISLFAEENRLQKLSELGDCLERLKIIDRESFRPIIALTLIRERKSNAVRSIGIERAAFNIGLTNLVYNLCRYSFLSRKEAVVG